MCILQYFVFDISATYILEASGISCQSHEELLDLANTMVESYHNSSEMKGLGLLLNDNTNGTVLYNSKEEK